LFISGHDRLAYGELPDGNQVAEIDIPKPVKSKNLGDLPVAKFRQGFQDVAKGFFKDLDEIPRVALQYYDTPATGPKIHLAWGQHMQPDPPAASHAWFNPDLKKPGTTGTWFIGAQSLYSVNGYMLEIPIEWADKNTGGRSLGTGRYKDGGWSGMGPALFAYRPWEDTGAPAPPGTRLSEKVLLLYQNSQNSDKIEHCLKGYQHPDEWEGAAWIETKTGKSAVLFAGTKSTGAKYWYGYIHPQGPAYPCVDQAFVGQFPVCRSADGKPCPVADLRECAGHQSYRGWWSTRFDAQFILYDPTDLARVAQGRLASWEPQPYAVLDIDESLFLNPDNLEPEMLGTADQRRYRIGEITVDRGNGLLYILELFADQARPVVHVWKVRQ